MGLFSWLFKKRGDKISQDIDSIVKNAEKQIAGAKKVKQLKKLIDRLNDKKIDLVQVQTEMNVPDLVGVQGDLVKIQFEIGEIKAGRKKRSREHLERLERKIKELEKTEADLNARLQKFEEENLRLEDLDIHIARLDQMILKAQRKMNELAGEVVKESGKKVKEMREQLNKDIQDMMNAIDIGEEPEL